MKAKISQKQICPNCNSTKVAEIIYGYVKLDKQGEQELEDGKIVLGGCCIEENDPQWHCNACFHRWGTRETI